MVSFTESVLVKWAKSLSATPFARFSLVGVLDPFLFQAVGGPLP